ncbi:hypothetical protein [Bacillus bombysepticus]|uniref:hypothetical protein n=1 Tax=Bacillus bombysepticus TaxID=658666 RepID=UPI0030198B20
MTNIIFPSNSYKSVEPRYHTIEKLKEEFNKDKVFSHFEYTIFDVFPKAEFLGTFRQVLGYESKNPYLLGIYRVNGIIYHSSDSGNSWITYGITEENFAKEIEEALKKKQI